MVAVDRTRRWSSRRGPQRAVVASTAVLALVIAGCTSSTSDGQAAPTTDAVVAAQGQQISASTIQGSFATLDGIVTDVLNRTGVPGASVAVVYGDEVVYTKGYGLRELGKPEEVDADTVFQLASLSKPFGSTVVAGIVSDGKVSWDDPVTKWDPTTLLSDPWVSDHATIGDYYSHRTGLPGQAPDGLTILGFDQGEILSRLRYLPLDRFRDSYSYSNIGTTAGGVAAATGAGTTFADAADQKLFAPAGMTSSSFRHDDFTSRANRVALHANVNGSFTPGLDLNDDVAAPAGGASANANDMGTWLRIELADGKLGDTQIIEPEALAATYRSAITRTPAGAPVTNQLYSGYGWNGNQNDFGMFQLQASGAFPAGASTTVRLLPTEGFGIVVLTNGAPVGAPEAIVDSYIDQLIAGAQTKDWTTFYRQIFEPTPDPDESEAAAETAPPKAATTYTGTYTNDFYGTITISEPEAGKLVMAAGPNGTSTFALEPVSGDTFAFDPGPIAAGQKLPVAFTVAGATATNLTLLSDPANPDPWSVLTKVA